MDETKYLAIDYGKTRVGLATAASLAKISSPKEIIGSLDSLEVISDMVADYQVVVVGSPRDMNGNYGEMSHQVSAWYNDLINLSRSKGHPADFVLFDETLSSVRAREAATALGRDSRDYIDDLAAAIILQDYLDQIR